jgi:hypothetical protein
MELYVYTNLLGATPRAPSRNTMPVPPSGKPAVIWMSEHELEPGAAGVTGMPEMDDYKTMPVFGRDTACRDLPFIALAAKAIKEGREKYLESGASDYLVNPVDTEQILLALCRRLYW